jgi:hypothetical protein
LEGLRDGEGSGPRDHGDDSDVVDHEVVHTDEQGRARHRIYFMFSHAPELVVRVVPSSDDVGAGPLVRLLRHFPGTKLAHEGLRVWVTLKPAKHLEIGREMCRGVGVAGI